MKTFLVLLSLITMSSGYCAVYKCEINGSLTYSQFPCGNNAEKVNIRVSKGNSKVTSSNNRQPTDFQETNLYIQIKKIDRDILYSQNKIVTYQRKMKSEINQLQIRASYANNNLAGATYEGALSSQMGAVATKYDSLISVEHKKIDRLTNKKTILIKTQKKLKEPSTKSNIATSQENNVDDYIKDQKFKRDKLKYQNKIKYYQHQMNNEIEQLKLEASLSNNNLAGARYEKAKADKMMAVATKYNILINIEQKKIDKIID
jgi:hypothetical protein